MWHVRNLHFFLIFVSSGNAASGNVAAASVPPPRSMPRPMHVVGMQRMPNTGMPAFNVATQTGIGAPASGNIPMQRGAAAQAHQQQGWECRILVILSRRGAFEPYRAFGQRRPPYGRPPLVGPAGARAPRRPSPTPLPPRSFRLRCRLPFLALPPTLFRTPSLPLLLRPPRPHRRRQARHLLAADGSGGFSLHALDDLRTPYRSLIPVSSATADLCLAYSHGYLILLRGRSRRDPVLADVLTGAEILLPALPPDRVSYYYGTLTAPPASPDCCLLLFYSKYSLMCCRIGEPHPEWALLPLKKGQSYIARVLRFKDRIFAISDLAKLLTLEFVPEFKVERLDVGGLRTPPAYDQWHFGPQLVECGGELLAVLFVQEGHPWITGIHVFRLDFGRMEWVQVESLGDHCLFIDCGGKCPVSGVDPSCWGGRSNCVCVAAPGVDAWLEYSLDDKTWTQVSASGDTISSRLLPQRLLSRLGEPRWPSPVWVYPSLFFWRDDMVTL
ncbi:hypothetical protein B296_00041599 [Ensete ventricosum]|uniref:KIB1-4 beta-propeller domain-containing protein n=1 Tax=Ensete ventricosum TaxID=4639 RepID=A0A426ZH96_ENSVE|nr:hypothetical protein B296_00041599 [Ensete ventricosum]